MFLRRLRPRFVVTIATTFLVIPGIVGAQASNDAPDLVVYGRIRDEGTAVLASWRTRRS